MCGCLHHAQKKMQCKGVFMIASSVLGVSVGLMIVFLTIAVVYRWKIVRLKKQLYQTRFNLILCRGSRPQPQAERNLALFFDETENQFKPLNTAVEDAD
jgi:hypothetical protein